MRAKGRKDAAAIAFGETEAAFVRCEASGAGALLKECRSFPLIGRFVIPLSITAPPEKNDLLDFFRNVVKVEEIDGAGVAISLPDTFANTSVIEFEELPPDERERDEVVKWKAAKAAFMKPEESSVGYQLLPSPSTGGRKVLAVVVRKDVMEVYEDVLKELGKEVARISINSLSVVNLICAGAPGKGNSVLILGWKGYFSFFAFREGAVDFYRCKEAEGENGLLYEMMTSFSFYTGRNPDVVLEKVRCLCGKDAHIWGRLRDTLEVPVETVEYGSLLKKAEGVAVPDDVNPLIVLAAAGAALLNP